jgi:hypothetical protein
MVRHVSRRQHVITLAERVLACYDLHGVSLTLVSETANAVFHVALPSGRPQRLLETGRTSDGAEYALRLRPPGRHRTQSIAEALQWLLALRRDTDLVVPEPVPACDGTLIQESGVPAPGMGGAAPVLSLVGKITACNDLLARCRPHWYRQPHTAMAVALQLLSHPSCPWGRREGQEKGRREAVAHHRMVTAVPFSRPVV